MHQPNPAPDLSAVPGGRVFAVLSLLALVLFVGQLLLTPALVGFLAILAVLLTGLVVAPLAVTALGRRLTRPTVAVRQPATTPESAPRKGERRKGEDSPADPDTVDATPADPSIAD